MKERHENHKLNIQRKGDYYYDIVRFPLNSAGAFLKIKVFSFSVGSKPDISGEV